MVVGGVEEVPGEGGYGNIGSDERHQLNGVQMVRVVPLVGGFPIQQNGQMQGTRSNQSWSIINPNITN